MNREREMVEVILYADGTYDINDIDSDNATQKLYGRRNGKPCDIYFCPKVKQASYLLKLIRLRHTELVKDIKMKEKMRKQVEKLELKILAEIDKEQENNDKR